MLDDAQEHLPRFKMQSSMNCKRTRAKSKAHAFLRSLRRSSVPALLRRNMRNDQLSAQSSLSHRSLRYKKPKHFNIKHSNRLSFDHFNVSAQSPHCRVRFAKSRSRNDGERFVQLVAIPHHLPHCAVDNPTARLADM